MKIISNMTVKLKIDNTLAINLAKNLVCHGKSIFKLGFTSLWTKSTKGNWFWSIVLLKIKQADVFTKVVQRDQFLKLKREMGIVCFDSLN
jgi:hypothetical protein